MLITCRICENLGLWRQPFLFGSLAVSGFSIDSGCSVDYSCSVNSGCFVDSGSSIDSGFRMIFLFSIDSGWLRLTPDGHKETPTVRLRKKFRFSGFFTVLSSTLSETSCCASLNHTELKKMNADFVQWYKRINVHCSKFHWLHQLSENKSRLW